jgi:4-aminobutyrate aminotransferase
MFACEAVGVTPDILVIGKGLGGGLFPMAAVIAREELDVAPTQALGHFTHEKSPLGAAAALATLEVIEEEGLLNQARAMGAYALERLRGFQRRHGLISEVRGIGLQIAVELKQQGRPATAEAESLMYAALREGLSFKISSGNVLTLTPPLTITQTEMDTALAILEKCLAELPADVTAP